MNLPKTKIYFNSKIAKYITWMPGFKTIMLFGAVFTELPTLSAKTRIHESTHVAQYQDCIGLGFISSIILAFGLFALGVNSPWMWILAIYPFFLFYIIYGAEWVWNRVVKKQSSRDAYLSIGFEKQARWCADTWDKPCEEQNFYQSFGWWKLG